MMIRIRPLIQNLGHTSWKADHRLGLRPGTIPHWLKQRSMAFFSAYSQPASITELAVVQAVVDRVCDNKAITSLLSKTAFIGVQHLLGSNVALFKGLIDLGVNPQHMFFIGKPYSSSSIAREQIQELGIYLFPDLRLTNKQTYSTQMHRALKAMLNYAKQTISSKDIERIVILDEGFQCLEILPSALKLRYPIAGIEHTQAGLYSSNYNHILFPLIEVASSAAKKWIEPPMIADSILKTVNKFTQQVPLEKDQLCGVVGNGRVGLALVKHLIQHGYEVIVYDKNPSAFKYNELPFYRADNIGQVISNARYVFGCTGKDITENLDVLDLVKNDCTLISCSSGRNEFSRTIEQLIHQQHPMPDNALDDIVYTNEHGATITIVRGGFPINFDNSFHCVEPRLIQLTRGLVLGGCLQAALCARPLMKDGVTRNYSQHIALDPYLQRFVVECWQAENPDYCAVTSEELSRFKDPAWIIEESGGTFSENTLLSTSFHHNHHSPVPRMNS